jgi:hypothetical protein
MPLLEIPAEAAMARIRSGADTARWPGAGGRPERLEGAAEVACSPSFEIGPDDLIFTAGSCFARNIEFRLAEVGFVTPMYSHEIVRGLEALGEHVPFFNKYNVAVIRHELAWAAGEELETRELALLPSSDGQLVDALLNPRRKAGSPADQVRALRAYAEALYGRFAECRVVVITLGLAEIWRDRRSGLALNKTPPESLIRAEPDRFVLQVMDYGEILAELEAIHAVLSRHGHPDFRMLATVSPVPLMATFRDVDVLAANAYSKAVQRAALEAFVQARDNVDYFPSYETVTLSDRRLAFDEDNRHVLGPVVDRVVDRFLAAYAPKLDFEPSRRALVRSNSPGDAFERLLKAADGRMSDGRFAQGAEAYGRLIDEFGDHHDAIGATELRLRYGTCLIKSGRVPEGLAQFRLALAARDDHRASIFLKCADRLMQCGDPAAAAAALEVAISKGAKEGELAPRRAGLQAALDKVQ